MNPGNSLFKRDADILMQEAMAKTIPRLKKAVVPELDKAEVGPKEPKESKVLESPTPVVR